MHTAINRNKPPKKRRTLLFFFLGVCPPERGAPEEPCPPLLGAPVLRWAPAAALRLTVRCVPAPGVRFTRRGALWPLWLFCGRRILRCSLFSMGTASFAEMIHCFISGIAAGCFCPGQPCQKTPKPLFQQSRADPESRFQKAFTFRPYPAYFDIIPQLPAASTAKTEFHICPFETALFGPYCFQRGESLCRKYGSIFLLSLIHI